MNLNNLKNIDIIYNKRLSIKNKEQFSNASDNIIVEGEKMIRSNMEFREERMKTIGKALDRAPEVKKKLNVRCGRKPWLKRKREEVGGYNECRDKFYGDISRDKEFMNSLRLKELDNILKQEEVGSRSRQTTTTSNNNMKIGLGVGLLVVMLVGVILVTRK